MAFDFAWNSSCLHYILLVVICAASTGDVCTAPQSGLGCGPKSFESDHGSLLQAVVKNLNLDDLPLTSATSRETAAKETCSTLKKKGGFFTVAVDVGTPSQTFDLVADTGSNHVIVASCVCQDRYMCQKTDRCFRGTNRSTSFLISYKEVNGTRMPESMISIKFGSGTVLTAIASDVVKVGTQHTQMNNSLLLMIGKKLDFGGSFEGILGLGLPASKLSRRVKKARSKHMLPATNGFLETASVPRFGVCLNPGSSGVLRLSQAAAVEQLGAVGQSHWALNLGGFSIGDDLAASSKCANLAKHQKACVAIIDSGTTLIVAPKDHIVSLFADLCSRWDRCKKTENGASKDLEKRSKAFQSMLLDCNNYTSDSHGLDEELPELHMHVTGSNGQQRKLKLPGASYVYETMKNEIHYVHKNLFGIFPVDIPMPTGKKKKVCTPAFGAHQMKSVYHETVWILGQPMFYEFEVGYDLESKPPSMSFTKEGCGSCENGVVQKAAALVAEKSVARRPTLVRGPARMPSIDFSQPL